VNPYGDGRAACRSVDAVEFHAGARDQPPDDFDPELSASPLSVGRTRSGD
jgi:hypothetical protein